MKTEKLGVAQNNTLLLGELIKGANLKPYGERVYQGTSAR